MKLVSVVFTFIIFFLSCKSNSLHAKTSVETQLVTLNAQIDEFVTNKQYTEAIAFCNNQILKSKDEIITRSLLVSKMRLFIKSKSLVDSVPSAYNKQRDYQEDDDSLHYFLSARAEEILGHYYFKKYKTERAISLLLKADSLYALAPNYDNRVYNLNMLGTIYMLSDNLTDALITLTRADRMLDFYLPKDSALHIDLHIDIGLIYFKLGRYDKATSFYSPLLSYNLSIKQKAQILNNLAIISIEKTAYTKAIFYLKKAENLYTQLGNDDDLARVYNNLGSALQSLNYPNDSVINCFQKAILIKTISKDSVGLVSPTINLASFYIQNNYYDKLVEVVNTLEKLQPFFNVQDNASYYYFKSLLKERNKQYPEALAYYKLYFNYNDSLQLVKNKWQLTKAESEIELEKKQSRINLLQKEHDLAHIKANQQRYIILAISTLSLSLILILVLVARFYYKRQLLEKKIRKKSVKLASISSLVRGQEEERLRIAKDLHDGVGNNLAMIRAEIVKNISAENSGYLAQLVTQTAEEVRNITHDIMPVVIRKFGLIEALNDLVDKWKHTNQVFIDVNYESKLDIDKNTSLTIYRIIQELLKNSISHGEASYIIIIISQKKHELTLLYEDNGIGLKDEDLTSKSGIGMQNISNRVSYLNGTYKINKQSSGLKFTFVFTDLKNENPHS